MILPVQDNSITLSHDEVTLLSEIITSLGPIKACLQPILLLIFCLPKDADNNTSKKMRTALMIRIDERRTGMSGLLHYLRKVEAPFNSRKK